MLKLAVRFSWQAVDSTKSLGYSMQRVSWEAVDSAYGYLDRAIQIYSSA